LLAQLRDDHVQENEPVHAVGQIVVSSFNPHARPSFLENPLVG
jgi:hypothetical protein